MTVDKIIGRNNLPVDSAPSRDCCFSCKAFVCRSSSDWLFSRMSTYPLWYIINGSYYSFTYLMAVWYAK